MDFVRSGSQSPDLFPSPLTFLEACGRVGRRTGGLLLLALAVLAGSLISASGASAQTLKTLVSFDGVDAGNPHAGLIADAHGNLFGTTSSVQESDGTVFEITNSGGVYAGSPTILYSFQRSYRNGLYYGVGPLVAGLFADSNGNLLGTTQGSDSSAFVDPQFGSVFEIVDSGGVYASTPTTLFSFDYVNDGENPRGGLIADANGNLFGATLEAGLDSGNGAYGTVFEIANSGGVYASKPTTLSVFDDGITNNSGANPSGGVIVDGNGNLLGTTQGGGAYGYGTVFEIAKMTSGYAPIPTTLYSFTGGSDGAFPVAGLIADANGNLFGTTQFGGTLGNGAQYGYGTVFEIAKTTAGYAATPTILASFNGSDGAWPTASLIVDANGNLFGTTAGGGVSNKGTVFKIAKTTSGYGQLTPVYSFTGDTDGSYPAAGLIADANGNLFGTAVSGGTYGAGTVFEISGSGFAPPVKFAGTPGAANCKGATISTLADTYGGIAHAAASLGYNGVTALQTTVTAYCGQ